MAETDGSETKLRGRLPEILLLVILLLGITLQYAAAYQKSFWGDEAKTALRVRNGFETIEEETPADHQPLYIYMMTLWGKVFGYSEMGLRSLAILFATLTLVLTYTLGKDVYGEKTALISLAILSFSPLFLLHGHSARYYSIMTALAVLIALSLHRFQEMKKPWYLLVYAFAGTVMLYLVFNSVIFLAGCSAWWLWRFWRDRKRQVIDFVYWVLAQILILALYLPGTGRFSTFTENYFQIPQLTSWLMDYLKRLAFTSYLFGMGGTLSPLKPLAWIGIEVVVIIAVFALYAAWKRKLSWMPVFFTVWISLLAVLASFFSEWHNQIWQNISHWFLYVLPFLALWLGIGLAQMKFRIMAFMGSLLLVVYAVGIYNYFTDQQFIQPVLAAPWRNVYDGIKAESKPGAMVICTGVDTSCWYYAEQYGYPVSLPWELERKNGVQPVEVWWVHSNVGGIRYDHEGVDQEFLKLAEKQYENREVRNYILHEPSIRWLKTRLMGHSDYEYLVEVFHFSSP